MLIYQTLLKLTNYQPKDDLFTSAEEVKYVRETLDLQNATNDDLQNLRDFCVMMWSEKYHKLRMENDESWWGIMQSMQSITAVIDDEKYHRGMEV